MVVELRRACGSEEKLTKTQKIISHADHNVSLSFLMSLDHDAEVEANAE